jgi:arylsulfatase A-like enzyme/Tfp pilus assembly protein PilF
LAVNSYYMQMRKMAVLLFLLAAIAGAGFYYWKASSSKMIPPKNVLLITIDTLRSDHLGIYGYAPAQTPNIDRWAQQGARFLNATSTTPLTLPSHSSIMTGTYPLEHGVRDNGGFYLDEKWNTLAEILQTSGMKTGGFVSAFVLDHRWGIAQGFQEYFDHFELSKFKMVSLDSVQRRGDETLNEALSWIDKNKRSRFFAWIHFYDPHTPYDPPDPFRADFQDRPFGLYDGEISYVDNLIGRIQDYLEKNNLTNTTAIVLMSDHGESLGEHEETGHGFFVYDATMHIPLIIVMPGQKPVIVGDQVRSIDVYPTICDALGVKSDPAVRGVSLLPLMHGKTLPQKLTAYSESYYPRFHYGWSELKALRTAEYKYIDVPDREFYRLSKDPKEMENLYSTFSDKAAPFETELSKLLLQDTGVKMAQAMDDDSVEKLQALGYIGSFTPLQQGQQEGSLPDPKLKIQLYNLLKVAQWYSAEGKTKEAFDSIRKLIGEDQGILEAYLVLGNLYSKEKKYSEARASFEKALELNPEYASAVFGLAKTYKDEEKWEAAAAGFERLTKLDPRDSKPYFHLGDIASAQKKYQDALGYFQKAVDLDPEQGGSRNRLAVCYLEMEKYDDAEKEFREVLKVNPRMPNGNFNTALIYEAKGNLDQAIVAYRKELEFYPEAYPAHFNLSRIYRQQGRIAEEKAELEACIAVKPEYGIAYLYLAKNLMDSGGDLMKSKQLVEQGLKNLSEQSQIPLGHYLLADIYNRLGDSHQATLQVQLARQAEKK